MVRELLMTFGNKYEHVLLYKNGRQKRLPIRMTVFSVLQRALGFQVPVTVTRDLELDLVSLT